MSGRTLLAGLLLGGLALGMPPPAVPAAEHGGLVEAKLVAARKTYEATVSAMVEGKVDAEKVYLWSRRWLDAERDRSDKKADQVAAVGAHLGRMKELGKITAERYRAGQIPYADVLGTEFYVKEAELWLEQAQPK